MQRFRYVTAAGSAKIAGDENAIFRRYTELCKLENIPNSDGKFKNHPLI